MGTQKQSKTKLSWKQIVIFVVVEFIVVFGVLSILQPILQFLSLTSYEPFVAGAAGVGGAIAANLLVNRHGRTNKIS